MVFCSGIVFCILISKRWDSVNEENWSLLKWIFSVETVLQGRNNIVCTWIMAILIMATGILISEVFASTTWCYLSLGSWLKSITSNEINSKNCGGGVPLWFLSILLIINLYNMGEAVASLFLCYQSVRTKSPTPFETVLEEHYRAVSSWSLTRSVMTPFNWTG